MSKPFIQSASNQMCHSIWCSRRAALHPEVVKGPPSGFLLLSKTDKNIGKDLCMCTFLTVVPSVKALIHAETDVPPHVI